LPSKVQGMEVRGGEPPWLQASLRMAEFHAGEVHRNIESYVHIVCKKVERDMGDNLHDLAVVEPSRAQGLDIFVRDLPPLFDEF
jgi:hypothetical protein